MRRPDVRKFFGKFLAASGNSWCYFLADFYLFSRKLTSSYQDKMRFHHAVTITTVALALCNCASIVSKSDYPVTITNSKPTKIVVKNKATNGVVHTGTTPTTVTLSASEGYFKPAKYAIVSPKGTSSLDATMDPWYMGNIVFGGIIGIFIDPATGAMWKLPKSIDINQ